MTPTKSYAKSCDFRDLRVSLRIEGGGSFQVSISLSSGTHWRLQAVQVLGEWTEVVHSDTLANGGCGAFWCTGETIDHYRSLTLHPVPGDHTRIKYMLPIGLVWFSWSSRHSLPRNKQKPSRHLSWVKAPFPLATIQHHPTFNIRWTWQRSMMHGNQQAVLASYREQQLHSVTWWS